MYYYSPGTDKTYSGGQLLSLFGVDDSKLDTLAINSAGFYPVQDTSPTVDAGLYTLTYTWSIVSLAPALGEGAERVWSGSPRPLATAQASGIASVKEHSRNVVARIEEATGYTIGMLSGVASQLSADRPARFESVLADLATRAAVLDGQLSYIDAAITTDEVNAVVNPPAITASVDLARTGNDLDDSFVTAITGVSADDLSLYFNSTGTTVAYNPGTSRFPATVGVFTGGDYTGVIKYLGIFNLATFDLATSPLTVPVNWEYEN